MKIAITGGTGTLGRALIARLLAGDTERVVSVSRDEVKAGDLQAAYPGHPRLRVFLGSVRDKDRLVQAFQGCDTIIHAAALKRVEQGSYSPGELIKTNIQGTINAIWAAAEVGAKKFIFISSDKAVHATNLYGATKFTAECYATGSNAYTYPRGLYVSVTRYGNVLGSRGSVIQAWRGTRSDVALPLTHPDMTRFIITQAQAVDFVLGAVESMQGGEIFVPDLPAARLVDLAEALYPGRPVEYVGLRPGGEKLHEMLVSQEEKVRLWEHVGSTCTIVPHFRSWTTGAYRGVQWDDPPSFHSDTTRKLTVSQLRTLCTHL